MPSISTDLLVTSEALAIRGEGVSKLYHIWHSPSARLRFSVLSQLHRTLRVALERDTPALRALARWREALVADFEALRGVSFTVRRGESVGIIGRNGSGKSTLLQVIAGTLRPTSGEVEVEGRVAAMLELGSGFNPEFTGRENVYLNASILGLNKQEIDERLDAIVDFADLGMFIDQPVKTYSSGMVVRLGFAVLTQIEPDILIIDEALSVGDFLFQQKCFDCIRQFKERGCTLLFVSHAMNTVMELCDRALLLDSGHLAYDGLAKDAVNLYEASALRSRFQTGSRPLQIVVPAKVPTAPSEANLAHVASSSLPERSELSSPVVHRNGTIRAPQRRESEEAVAGPDPGMGMDTGSLTSEDAALQFVHLYDASGMERNWVTSEEEVVLVIGILCARNLHDPHVGFKIRDRLGRILFETSSLCMRRPIGPVAAGQMLVSNFRFALPIMEGEYSVTVGFANGGVGTSDYAESLLFLHGVKTFRVYKNPAAIIWSGVFNLHPSVTYSREAAGSYQMDALSEEQAARVQWKLGKCPARVEAGREFVVTLHVSNGSDHTLNSFPPHPVSVSYHWKDANTHEVVVQEGNRTLLTPAVTPAQEHAYTVNVLAPEQAGEFLLQVTLVQENVRWFEEVRSDLLVGRRVQTVGGTTHNERANL